MKVLWLLPLLFLFSCGSETGNSKGFLQKFQDVCATYREPEFEARLAKLIATGESVERFQDLLAVADQKRSAQGVTTHVFSYSTGTFAEQGLVVSITVDDKSGLIEAVEFEVAAN